MGRYLLVVLMVLLTTSCASLNPLDVLNPNKPSLEVNTQLGKTNESESNNIKVETGKQEYKQEAEKISNDRNYNADKIENIVQGMSLVEFVIVVLLAGIAIPKASEVYRGVKVVVSDVWGAVVLAPIKAIGSLFGR